MSRKPETRRQQIIRRELEESFPDGYWRKIHGGMFQAGLPDLVGCVGGLFFGFEVKMDNEDASELQKTELEAIRDAGGIAAIIYSAEQAVKLVRTAITRAKRRS